MLSFIQSSYSKVYNKPSTLDEPLLMEDSKETPSSLTARRKNDDKITETDSTKIYAPHAPRILLEIMTGRSAAIVIAITWIVFLIGFTVDLVTTYRSFHSSNYALGANSCSDYNFTEIKRLNLAQYGCSYGGDSWNSSVTHLSNVISFGLSVQQTNLTSLLSNSSVSTTFDIKYDLQVWTCYNENGCGSNFEQGSAYTEDANVWQPVLSLSPETASVDLSTDITSYKDGKKLEIQLITNTFQNQESIPTNGLVKAYHINLQYLSDPYNLFSGDDPATLATTSYTMNIVRIPANHVAAGFNVFLLIITIAGMIYYCYIISRLKKVISEQKWLIAYFVLVILFQNPVYCVIFWFKTPPSPTAAYAAFIVSNIAQAGLFSLWLLFASSYQRKKRSIFLFYVPKLLVGGFILSSAIAILTYQFPSLSIPATDRSAVQAVQNWSDELKQSLVAVTILFLSGIWLWAFLWFSRLWRTGTMMKRLPYMSTRYMQLSFRFFTLQATLVTIYYIFQYAAVIFFISSDTASGYQTTLTVVADNINVLFRQQFQLIGKITFLTVYAMLLAFMFLPPEFLDSTGIYTSVAATYAISEIEHKAMVQYRKMMLRKLKKNLLTQVTRIDQIVQAKEDIFCVELALKCRELSFQAYYDSPTGAETASNYGTNQDLPGLGYTIIEEFYDPSHEVYCLIAREIKTGRIFVVFRGTASKKQMEDNMNYGQRPIKFEDMSIPSLDHLDNLSFNPNAEADAFELESVEDEDEAIDRQQQQQQQQDEFDKQMQSQEDVFRLTISQRMPSQSPYFPSSSNDDHENNPWHYPSPIDISSANNTAQHGHGTGQGVQHQSSVTSPRYTMYNPHTITAANNNNDRDTIIDSVTDNVSKALNDTISATNQGIDMVLNTTSNIITSTAKNTPGLKKFVTPNVHNGFYEAYTIIRGFLHGILRAELMKNPNTVVFTGHSLGGALATFAAIDFKLTTLPRITRYLKHQAKLHLLRTQAEDRVSSSLMSATAAAAAGSNSRGNVAAAPITKESSNNFQSLFRSPFGSSAKHQDSQQGGQAADLASNFVFVQRIKVVMYNFGSPKVGNGAFQQLYDREVPRSYRVVVDGDLVAGLPPSGYKHIGTEVLIDSLGVGTIIIDPSFVERWLRTTMKSSVSVHSLLVYRKGLLGVQLASEYLSKFASERRNKNASGEDMDASRLAINWRSEMRIEELVEREEKDQQARNVANAAKAAQELLSAKESAKEAAEKKVDDSSYGRGSKREGSSPIRDVTSSSLLRPSETVTPSKVDEGEDIESGHTRSPPYAGSDEGVGMRDLSEVLRTSTVQQVAVKRAVIHSHDEYDGNEEKADQPHQKGPSAADYIRGAQEEEYYAQEAEHINALMSQIRGIKNDNKAINWVKRSASSAVPEFIKKQISNVTGHRKEADEDLQEGDDEGQGSEGRKPPPQQARSLSPFGRRPTATKQQNDSNSDTYQPPV